MTLIAEFKSPEAPVLVGDLLLSRNLVTGHKASLPLIGDVNKFIADRGLQFETSVTQKLNIVSDRLAVAWCGPIDEARILLGSLEEIASNSSPTAADVESALGTINPRTIDGLSFVGFVLEDYESGGVRARRFSMRMGAGSAPYFGPVLAAGTGSKTFLDILSELGEQSPKMDCVAKQDLPLAVGASLVGMLTGLEMQTGQSITERWGAGFEVAYIEKRRFKKLGNLLHSFWTYERTGDGRISAALKPFFYKVDYANDVMLIRSIELDVNSRPAKLVKNDLHAVLPTLRSRGAFDFHSITIPNFSHRCLYCHLVGLDGVMSLVRNNADQTLTIDVRDEAVDIGISSILMNEIHARLQAGPPS